MFEYEEFTCKGSGNKYRLALAFGALTELQEKASSLIPEDAISQVIEKAASEGGDLSEVKDAMILKVMSVAQSTKAIQKSINRMPGIITSVLREVFYKDKWVVIEDLDKYVMDFLPIIDGVELFRYSLSFVDKMSKGLSATGEIEAFYDRDQEENPAEKAEAPTVESLSSS